MVTERKPVEDWTSDYDIFDPQYIKNPFPVWQKGNGKRWGLFKTFRQGDLLFDIAFPSLKAKEVKRQMKEACHSFTLMDINR